MARVAASRTLLASRWDVWEVVAEPHNLAGWWPGYLAVRPGDQGLAAARWTVVRGPEAGLFQRSGAEGRIEVDRVSPGAAMAWRDHEQAFRATIELEDDGNLTLTTLTLETARWRLLAEGLRAVPARALANLHALCDTAGTH